jgi:hypothetical protein
MKRTVPIEVIESVGVREPSAVVRAYIKHTRHGQFLGVKSIVGLYPENIIAVAIWRTRRRTVVAE